METLNQTGEWLNTMHISYFPFFPNYSALFVFQYNFCRAEVFRVVFPTLLDDPKATFF